MNFHFDSESVGAIKYCTFSSVSFFLLGFTLQDRMQQTHQLKTPTIIICKLHIKTNRFFSDFPLRNSQGTVVELKMGMTSSAAFHRIKNVLARMYQPTSTKLAKQKVFH